MFDTKISSVKDWYKKITTCFYKPKGKKKYTVPIFDNELLSSSKAFKIGPKGCVFSTQNDDICDYNPQCFMSSSFMIDDIIMNLFTDTTEQQYMPEKIV